VGTDADAEPLGVGDPDSTEHAASARQATRHDQDARFMTFIGYGSSPVFTVLRSVPCDGEHQGASLTETGRLETFSDGVFAIAITLLVLGIGVPEPDEPLVGALVDQWPAFFAYVVSFLTIGVMWINHHQLFLLIGRSNMTFALIHVVFLMFVAFLPYPTDVLAERLGSGVDEVAATVLYGGTMTAIAVMYNAIWLYASGNGGRLLKSGIDEQIRRAGARGYQYGPLGYLLITLLALINPLISLAGFAAYAVYWALPVSGPVSPSEG
jgi:uncharacterized membrane protein